MKLLKKYRIYFHMKEVFLWTLLEGANERRVSAESFFEINFTQK